MEYVSLTITIFWAGSLILMFSLPRVRIADVKLQSVIIFFLIITEPPIGLVFVSLLYYLTVKNEHKLY